MVSIVLLVLAIACFVLKALGLDLASLDLLAWGLAFGFASMLPWKR